MSGVVPELFDVTLHANNVEELGHFYASLGLRQAIDDEDLKVFILGVNELEIHRNDTPQTEAVTIRVRVAQLEPLQRNLRQRAIDYQAPGSDEDGLSMLVRDPNGNLVQFVEAKT